MNNSSSNTPAAVSGQSVLGINEPQQRAAAGWGRVYRVEAWAWSLAAECADSLWGVAGDLARWVGRKAREADYRAQLKLENEKGEPR